ERVGFHGAHVSARAIEARGDDPSKVDVDFVVYGGHFVHVHDVLVRVRGVRPTGADVVAPRSSSSSGAGGSDDDAHDARDDTHDDAGATATTTTTVRAKRKAHGDELLDPDRVAERFKTMCWKPDAIVDAMFRGTVACFSQQHVRE